MPRINRRDITRDGELRSRYGLISGDENESVGRYISSQRAAPTCDSIIERAARNVEVSRVQAARQGRATTAKEERQIYARTFRSPPLVPPVIISYSGGRARAICISNVDERIARACSRQRRESNSLTVDRLSHNVVFPIRSVSVCLNKVAV